MELITQGTPTKEQYYQIFQSPNNFLQVSIFPHHSVYIQKNAIAYTSPNIIVNCSPKPTPENTILPNVLELTNQSETLAYAGISNTYGRIIFIDPTIQHAMLLRESSILAYTYGITFEEPNSAFKIKDFKSAHIKENSMEGEKVVLQTGAGIMEKMLGKGEEFYVSRNRVIGLQNTVRLEMKVGDCFVGPGLVLIDTSQQVRPRIVDFGRYILLLLVIVRIVFAFI